MMGATLKILQDKQGQTSLATDIIAAQLLEDIHRSNQASLMVSGGSTPGPVYDKLSKIPMDWDKVKIGLVDERWVGEKDTGSNAAFIRKSLLKNLAHQADFTPMKTEHTTALEGQASVESQYKKIPHPYSVVVLGMGADGHTASWFAGSDGLEQALSVSNENTVQAITAKPSDVTGAYLERMSLTRSAIGNCKLAILLITGEEKLNVFNNALAGHSNLPVKTAIDALGKRLIVLWAP